MTKKACKNCHKVTESSTCPACGSAELSSRFSGVVLIFDPEKSEVAKRLSIKTKGEYALIVQ